MFDVHTLVRDYGDVDGEAAACRQASALFDFSFMARARLCGRSARNDLQDFVKRDLSDLRPGRIRYALRVDAAHAVSADLTVWCLADDEFELMSGRQEDIAACLERTGTETVAADVGDECAVFAVQGPRTLEAVSDLVDHSARLGELTYFSHDAFDVAGHPCRVGRLGYTGEAGFEILVPAAAAAEVWDLLAARAAPAGFAATDRLRIEAGFMLFANECRTGPTPLELGLAAFYNGSCPAPGMRLTSFTARAQSLDTPWQPARAILPPPAPGEIAVTSACRVGEGSDGVLGLGFVCASAAGEGCRDPTGVFEDIRLLTPPIYDPSKGRPRRPWAGFCGRN